ncbi:MAG: hypothetical protein KGN30_06495, partial [Nitrospirota bacterium]|nr:hypothetical protein [Nitrospirota bacterium]
MGKDSLPLILCFGDSLTAGYQSPTMARPQARETPYGRFLQDRLGMRAQVAVSGLLLINAGLLIHAAIRA